MKWNQLIHSLPRGIINPLNSKSLQEPVGCNHAHVTPTLPNAGSANLSNAPGLRSRSVALQPTPKWSHQYVLASITSIIYYIRGCLHRSTTVRSTLRSWFTCSSNLLARILRPHSGFAFGLDPVDAVSNKTCETAHMSSLSVLVMPHAPSAGL